LVCDADGFDAVNPVALPFKGRNCTVNARFNRRYNLKRVMLMPARIRQRFVSGETGIDKYSPGLWIDLLEFKLVRSNWLAGLVEYQEP
jgi:hypothetical protein